MNSQNGLYKHEAILTHAKDIIIALCSPWVALMKEGQQLAV